MSIRINSPEYLMIGQHQTGLPGSRRIPRLTAAAQFTVAAVAQVSLDPQIFINDRPHWLFVTELIVSVTNTNSYGHEAFIQIVPTFTPPWTHGFVPVHSICETEGLDIDQLNNIPFVWLLPEPVPMPPGASFNISVQNRDSGTSSTVLVGVNGYYETEPRFTKPRKVPFGIGARLQGNLAASTADRFNEGLLSPGFAFFADRLGLINLTTAYVQDKDGGAVIARWGIKGHPRIVDSRIESVIYDAYSRSYPLYGTRVAKGEGFQVEVEDLSAVDRIVDVGVVGYRA